MSHIFQHDNAQRRKARDDARARLAALRDEASAVLGRSLAYGECFCGCGEQAPLSSKTRVGLGHVKGEPVGYIPAHAARKKGAGGLRSLRIAEQARTRPRTREGMRWDAEVFAAETDDYRVEDCGFDTSCWVWRKARYPLPYNYGKLGRNGQHRRAHVWYYEQLKGRVPPRHDLHHRCENPPCVNPDHLVPLTRADHKREHARLEVSGNRRPSGGPE